MSNPLVRGSVGYGIGIASRRPSLFPILAIDPSATLRRWIARHRQRRALAELDHHLLQDIGVSQDHAWREAAKWFWQK